MTSSPPPRRHSPHSEKINTDSQTEISSKAKELSHVKDLATNTPDVREEKVAELKKKLSDGSYSVNASKVCRSLSGRTFKPLKLVLSERFPVHILLVQLYSHDGRRSSAGKT